MASHCFIDIQGFTGLYLPQEITPKEIAVKWEDGRLEKWYIKPPAAFPYLDTRQRKLVHWCVLNHHGLGYSIGDITQSDIITTLREKTAECETIYTKCKDKRLYLERILGRPVVDLRDLGCPAIKTATSDNCKGHYKPGVRCAVAGVEFLHDWYGHRGSVTVPAKTKQTRKKQILSNSMCGQPDTEEPEAASCFNY